MPFVRAPARWWLLAPALALVGAWWLRAPSAHEGAESRAAVFAPAPLAPAPVQPERLVARTSAVGPGLPLPQRAGLEQPDLYRYAQQLRQALAQGDAGAGWMLSRVYDYCAGYARDPAGYAGDSAWMATQANPGVAALHEARDRVAARCAGFAPADGLSWQQVVQAREDAAAAGNLAAEASLLALGQPLDGSTAYKRGLVQRVLASRDPEAYLALSPAMGVRAAGDDSYRGFVAGDQYAELAWQVAACRLGLDCGAQGSLMTSYCANAGICSQDAAQDFESFVYDAAVPRQGSGTMDAMVEALVAGEGVKS